MKIIPPLAVVLFATLASAQDAALSALGSPLLGQSHSFTLASSGQAGQAYVAALALSSSPGIPVGSRVLALNADPIFLASIAQPQPAALTGFQSTLSATGTASMSLLVPADPNLAGLAFYTAFATLDAAAPQGVGAISNTLRREIRAVPPPLDFTAVDAALAATSASWQLGVDGIVLAVIKDGEIVHEQAFGSFATSTRVPIASATKWVTAVTIMTLVRDGLVGLDDPVALYLPSFTGPKAAITIRQCLAHTSGLPANAPAIGDETITLAQCADQIAQGPLLAVPGTVFRYGGVSMQVAGRVAEVVTGQSWAVLFQDRVASPLGMTTFAYDAFGATANPRLAGGGMCTSRDYALLLSALLDGGALGAQPLLSTRDVYEIFQDQTQGAVIVATPQPDDRRYGLGCWRDQVGSYGQPQVISSPGAFGAWPWIDLERGYAGFLLIQRSTDFSIPILGTIIPLIEAQI
jgi:serine-type D-Ala-D-Ala carboxypeptidase/endopeptidase